MHIHVLSFVTDITNCGTVIIEGQDKLTTCIECKGKVIIEGQGKVVTVKAKSKSLVNVRSFIKVTRTAFQ